MPRSKYEIQAGIEKKHAKSKRYEETEGERQDYTMLKIDSEKLGAAIKKFFTKNAEIPRSNAVMLIKTLRKLCEFYKDDNDEIDLADLKKMEKTLKAAEVGILTIEEKEILKQCMNRLMQEWNLHQEAIGDILKALTKIDVEKFDVWKFFEPMNYYPYSR